MHITSMNSLSPSFTTNSSNNNLADIAARVIKELRNENGHVDDDIYNFTDDGDDDNPDHNFTENLNQNEKEHNDDEEEEFEFAVVCRNPNSSPVSADEIFSNGEILPRYPLFDRSLLLKDVVSDQSNSNLNPDKISVSVSLPVRQPLGKLFREERETASCSSTSEADDLAGVSPETYCIWKPKEESPEKCKKSNSTGNTSKRWRLRNLLQRSNSDSRMAAGKEAPVADHGHFPATKKKGEKTAKVAGADDDVEMTSVTDSSGNKGKGLGSNRFRSYLRHANVSGVNRGA